MPKPKPKPEPKPVQVDERQRKKRQQLGQKSAGPAFVEGQKVSG
jgi:hypothetical protein